MKQPIQVVMLQTEHKGVIVIRADKPHVLMLEKYSPYSTYATSNVHRYIHLYITVSQEVEKIKEGDWAMYLEQSTQDNPYKGADPYLVTDVAEVHWNDRKIIATTDPKLCTTKQNGNLGQAIIKPIGLQQSFIKEYCSNPNGEWEVEYEANKWIKELGVSDPISYKLKLNQDNTVNITPVVEKMYSREEVEEFILNIVKDISYGDDELIHHYNGDFKDAKAWIKENL